MLLVVVQIDGMTQARASSSNTATPAIEALFNHDYAALAEILPHCKPADLALRRFGSPVILSRDQRGKDMRGWQALEIAAYFSDPTMCEILLGGKPDLSRWISGPFTVDEFADLSRGKHSRHGFLDRLVLENLDTIRAVKEGRVPVDANGFVVPTAPELAPSCLANVVCSQFGDPEMQAKCILLFVEHGYSDTPNKDGVTALMLAAEHGQDECVATLLAQPNLCSPTSRDREGNTALDRAFMTKAVISDIADSLGSKGVLGVGMPGYGMTRGIMGTIIDKLNAGEADVCDSYARTISLLEASILSSSIVTASQDEEPQARPRRL